MKKFYWYSFLTGLVSGVIVVSLPYAFEPLGEVFAGFYNALTGLFSAGGFPNLALYYPAFFICSLPLFVIFLVLPAQRRAIQASRNKFLSVLFSLIFFKVGVLLIYGVWLFFAFAALSGSSLIF